MSVMSVDLKIDQSVNIWRSEMNIYKLNRDYPYKIRLCLYHEQEGLQIKHILRSPVPWTHASLNKNLNELFKSGALKFIPALRGDLPK